MKPDFDLYVWTCENGHYFAMSTTGWLQPGSMTPPKNQKQWDKHFEQSCPFCLADRKGRSVVKPLRKLYKVTELELVTAIDEETQATALRAAKERVRTVRVARRKQNTQDDGEESEVLEPSLEE